MKAKQISILCTMVLISCVLVGCGNAPKEPGRYYNRSKGFSIKLPDGWKKQNAGMGVLVKVTNPENTADIGVQVGKIPPQQTIADYVKFMKSSIQGQGGQIVRDGQTVIDGTDAYWFIIRIRSAKILYYCIKKGDSVYTMIFASDGDTFSDDFEDKMRNVAKSLRFE